MHRDYDHEPNADELLEDMKATALNILNHVGNVEIEAIDIAKQTMHYIEALRNGTYVSGNGGSVVFTSDGDKTWWVL
jgi:hypothetical protein